MPETVGLIMAGPSEQIPLAHSPSKDRTEGDPYARHVVAVQHGAVKRAEEMLRYASDVLQGLRIAIEAAAVFHDLGKLDPDIQSALRKGRGAKLKWDHVDAGVAHTWATGNKMSAWLIRSHHAPGLPQKAEHFTEKTDRHLRGRRNDDEPNERHTEQIARTNSLLGEYLRVHELVVGTSTGVSKAGAHGLAMRLALSCIVDADYTDSAFCDTGRLPSALLKPRWDERLMSLREYVRNLPAGSTDAERARNRVRNDFFDACLTSEISAPLVACEGTVGVGKTTAVAAYLLRRARDEGLRRLIVVAPFTNILSQTANILRRALVLPDEDPFEVIVEHHHRADFSRREDREVAVLWRAPIVLTTAVSFFETLAACDPGSLRKLHSVPGSAVFLDEAHAALPTKLWPQNWKWVKELALNWGCRFVFASGSLARFWENQDIIDPPTRVPELIPERQAVILMKDERDRVVYSELNRQKALSIRELIDLVKKQAGPRLVILNTVQNAAVIATALRNSGMDVLHISTALTPIDREAILGRVQRRLQFRDIQDWTLVATSCVEAGVDLSFRCAFRERFATASIIQVGGRVNRHAEYSEQGGGRVYDFALVDKGITQHPAASVSADVQADLMRNDTVNNDTPSDIVTEAMREELKRLGGLSQDLLAKAEAEQDYPKVNDLGRVIAADTKLVVIDPNLLKALRNQDHVTFKQLLDGSVQIWANKIDKLGLVPINRYGDGSESGIYEWKYDYDPDFLGYMAGVLKIDDFMNNPEARVI